MITCPAPILVIFASLPRNPQLRRAPPVFVRGTILGAPICVTVPGTAGTRWVRVLSLLWVLRVRGAKEFEESKEAVNRVKLKAHFDFDFFVLCTDVVSRTLDYILQSNM